MNQTNTIGFFSIITRLCLLLLGLGMLAGCAPLLDGGSGAPIELSVRLSVAAVFLDAEPYPDSSDTAAEARFLLPETRVVKLVITNTGNNSAVASPTVQITQSTDAAGHLLLSGSTETLALPTAVPLRFSASIAGIDGSIIASASHEATLTAGADIDISLFLLPAAGHPALVVLNDSNLPDVLIPAGQSRILQFDAPANLVGRMVGTGFKVSGDASKLQLAMRNQDGSAGSGFSYTARVGVHWVLPAAGIYYLICYNSGTSELALLDFNFNDTISPTVGNMRYVPDGQFQRDGTTDNITQVSAFLLSQFEITRAQYQLVMGTDPSLTANSSSTDDPVQNVSWYDTLVFCNRLSLLEGLTPVYVLAGSRNPAAWGTIPTVNDSVWNSIQADWMADGYRLPTDMEFIWASIGGRPVSETYTTDTSGYLKEFSGDDLGSATDLIEDYAWYGYGAGGNASEAKTRPVGSFRPNELTIYDLSGNVNEWCWDGFGTPPMGPLYDYRGIPNAPDKIRRGGSWATPDTTCAVINSDISASAEQKYGSMGFRVARVPLEMNNYLAGLIPGAGELEPSFKPETPEYMIQLDNSFSSINFSATAFAADEGATVSFVPGNPATLNVGPNDIMITVQGMRTGSRQYRVRVYRGAPGEILANKAGLLVSVPAGSFQYDVTVANIYTGTQDLYFGKFEVSRNLFKAVMGNDPSTGFDSLGMLAPAHYVNWYHAIAFCNKLSLLEGLTPVYDVSGISDWNTLDYSGVPTSDDAAWNAVTANWTASGYRLPTEMEWMWAAMGAASGYGYSAPTYLDGYSKLFAGSTGMNSIDDYAWYDTSSNYKIFPVGTRQANELGVHDMSGSISEWCWDWYNAAYPGGALDDTYRGAVSGTTRVRRGGTYNAMASQCTVAFRAQYQPAFPDASIGFRVVRNKP